MKLIYKQSIYNLRVIQNELSHNINVIALLGVKEAKTWLGFKFLEIVERGCGLDEPKCGACPTPPGIVQQSTAQHSNPSPTPTLPGRFSPNFRLSSIPQHPNFFSRPLKLILFLFNYISLVLWILASSQPRKSLVSLTRPSPSSLPPLLHICSCPELVVAQHNG